MKGRKEGRKKGWEGKGRNSTVALIYFISERDGKFRHSCSSTVYYFRMLWGLNRSLIGDC